MTAYRVQLRAGGEYLRACAAGSGPKPLPKSLAITYYNMLYIYNWSGDREKRKKVKEFPCFEVNRNDIKPLYVQAYDYLNNLIVSNILVPGDMLPSEKELGTMLGVSKITIRRAIQELVYDHKILRVAGKGSTVLKPKIEPLTSLTSFSENMLAQGYQPSYDQARVSLLVPHPKIAEYFNIQPDEKVLNIFRVMLANDIPMALQDTYLIASIYEKDPQFFTPELLNKISLYKVLEGVLGIKLYKADEWIEASKATQKEAELLCINKGDSVLVVERITYDVNKTPVEYVRQVHPANKYRYKVELFRAQKNAQSFERR